MRPIEERQDQIERAKRRERNRLVRPRGLWWISPVGALALVVPVSLWAAWKLPDETYRRAWGTAKALTTPTTLLLLGGMLILMVGTALPLVSARRRAVGKPWPNFTDRQWSMLATASTWLFWLTVFGYAAMGAAGVARGVRPSDIIAAFVDQNNLSGQLKAAFAPITGITSFTQIGVAFVVVAALLVFHRSERKTWLRLALILFLAFVRSFVATERLAILELIVPLIVVAAFTYVGDPRPRIRGFVKLAPVILIPAVVAVFAVFEYSRSWVFYKQQSSGSFVDFALERFAGYYATAYNNGQLALDHLPLDGHVPYVSIQALWDAPGISQLNLYGILNGGPPPDLGQVLTQYGNPEFNNECGLCDPFVDWGPVGGLIFFLCAGLLIGLVYRGFCNGSPVSTLVYPTLVTGLFEIPRYMYWTQGRVFSALVALVVVGLWIGNAKDPPAPLDDDVEPSMSEAAVP